MGDNLDHDKMREERPGQATSVAPAAGVASTTTALGALSMAGRAPGLHPAPDASLVNATPPVAPEFGFPMPGASVHSNADVLSGAGLDAGRTGPGVGAANAAGAGAAPVGGAAPAATGQGPAAGTGGTRGAGVDVTMSEDPLAAIIAQAIDFVMAKYSGVSPAPRPRAAVPEVFANLGITADEYEHLSTYMKAVKMAPPDKWADVKV